MLTGMGLALGIDYSLFVVSRYREERAHGLEKEDAIARSGATASRAVLFSGTTFIIALLGMFIVPTSIMRSLALGAILVGITSVAAALTLLPALLSMWGDGINRAPDPVHRAQRRTFGCGRGPVLARIVTAVLRHPALALAVSVAALLALALPVFGLHIGANGITTLPDSTPSKQGYLAVQRAFPTQNPEPVRIVAVGGGAAARRRPAEAGIPARRRPAVRADEARRRGGHVTARRPAARRPGRQRPDRRRAQPSLAHDPGLFAGSDAKVYVGGVTSENIDYFDAVSGATPYVILFVLSLSFILLTVAFRSIVVALVSVLLNLLSVGAAYGLLDAHLPRR